MDYYSVQREIEWKQAGKSIYEGRYMSVTVQYVSYFPNSDGRFHARMNIYSLVFWKRIRPLIMNQKSESSAMSHGSEILLLVQ